MESGTVSVEEYLQSFVNKIATEQKFQNFVTKIIPVISGGGANYTSNLYKLKIIHNGKDELDLFVKVGALSESMRNQFIFKPYDNEWQFYNSLMMTYRQLEIKHGVSEQDRMKVPAYYSAETTYGKEILILEDLASRGFGSANRFESVDWSYAAAAITELAKFHALSLAFRHENPSEFENFCAHFRRGFFEKNEGSDIFMKGVISSALTGVRVENKEKLEAFIKKQDFTTYFNDLYKPLNCNVILHADFRPSNLMHKVLNDGTIEVIPIDYQTIQPGSPVVDLLYFIFTATDGSFRANYFKKLINHYYAELGVALARFGLNVEHEYSIKDFEFDLKEKLPFGLLTSVMLLPGLTMSEDQAPAVGDDFNNIGSKPTGELYSLRLNQVIDEYISSGVL